MDNQPILIVRESMTEQQSNQMALSKNGTHEAKANTQTLALVVSGFSWALGAVLIHLWWTSLRFLWIFFAAMAIVSFGVAIQRVISSRGGHEKMVHVTTMFYQDHIHELVQHEGKPPFERVKRYDEIKKIIENPIAFIILYSGKRGKAPHGIMVLNKNILLKKNLRPDQMGGLRALFCRKVGPKFVGGTLS
ncbi:MAG: hypothetical protein FWE40_09805 [Oscillospiraceae bacterium]|nr:hypothetical protein [Oscillospiraceae bacterium]